MRTAISYFILGLFAVLASACASTTQMQRPETDAISLAQLRKQIDAALEDSVLSQTTAAIKVVSLADGETIYERNSNLLLHPASNQKLLTTATALTYLGPDFQFKTMLCADTSAVSDSAISGNLYLKGFANPDLSLPELEWLARQIRELGIKSISGDLVCDNTYLDDLYLGSGWMWDDASAWYWAPISAITVNDNCVTVKVAPGAQVGDSVKVSMEPRTAYMRLENFGVTTDSLDTLRLRQFKVERMWKKPENLIVVEGGMLAGGRPREFVIDVIDAALFAGTLVAETLREAGVALHGQVRTGTLPDASVVLATHLSEPLTNVIYNTNKISDNLSAELLLKTVGAEVQGTPGTAEHGFTMVKQLLAASGVDTTALGLADGSGSSRYNVISPDQIIKLLVHMHKDFRLQAEFQASLPIAGVDGTLSRRMQNTPAHHKLHAKTGTLRGVSTLSGYTTTADGEQLAFSIMMQNYVRPARQIRDAIDRVCTIISSAKLNREHTTNSHSALTR